MRPKGFSDKLDELIKITERIEEIELEEYINICSGIKYPPDPPYPPSLKYSKYNNVVTIKYSEYFTPSQ